MQLLHWALKNHEVSFGDAIFFKELNNNKIITYFILYLTIILIISKFQGILYWILEFSRNELKFCDISLLIHLKLNIVFTSFFSLPTSYIWKSTKTDMWLTEPSIFFKKNSCKVQILLWHFYCIFKRTQVAFSWNYVLRLKSFTYK